MSKAQTHIRQTNLQHKDAVGHEIEHTQTIDDNLLPDAAEIAKLHALDPTIIDWLKERATKEQDFRHSFNNRRADLIHKNEASNRTLNMTGLVFAFLLFAGGMVFSCYLIQKGQTVVGTVFTGFTLVAAAGLFITRKASIGSGKPAAENRQKGQ